VDPGGLHHLSKLATLLRSIAAQLTASRGLCDRLAEKYVPPARAAGTPRAPDATSARLRERLDAVHARATEVHQLATALLQQINNLRHTAASAGGEAAPATSPPSLHTIEAERARLARDLHDGPAQHFATAVMHLEHLQRLLARDPAAAAEALYHLRATLQQGIAEIRRCIADLRLPAVADHGLVALLRHHLATYERQFGIAVEADLPDAEPAVAPEQGIAIFRILQEALTNVRKHAGSQRVRVALRLHAEELVLVVEDDGCGFVPDLPRAGRYGLLGMRERAQLMGGRLLIHSQPGRGTRITLCVPQERPAGGRPP
jgi:signal transduction histidine kinase